MVPMKVLLCLLLLPIPLVSAFTAEIIESDINKDGEPDGWTHVENGAVVKQELDVNFDGKVDAVYYYEWSGKVKEEVLDTDYDGKMDNWRGYEDGSLIIDQLDSNQDGSIDLWFYVDRGKIIRLEKDTTGDGKPDTISEF
jgi:hypothetical protein